MSYLYKIVPMTADAEKDLAELGREGWELVSVTLGEKKENPDKAYLKKQCPEGNTRLCANCKHFSSGAEKDANPETPVWCKEWRIFTCAKGGCEERFVQKEVLLEVAASPFPVAALPDENSAWHWQPKTEYGEKRVEAITDEIAGIQSPPHRHRVLVIMAKDGGVVRGKTDMVNGHEHTIPFIGMTDEADGHTHGWTIPQG